MTTADIQRYFEGGEIEEICRSGLEELAGRIAANIDQKRTNSGNAVNSIGMPAATSGGTAASMRIETTRDDGGMSIALVGRKGIMNIDRGNPPAKDSGEYGSFASFYETIKTWARKKESRYGLMDKSINAYWVAMSVWELGGILYRSGGGTESITDLLQPAFDDISEKISGLLDTSIYDLLENEIKEQ